MSRINTRLTQLLGIRTPVVSAPMAGKGASGGALAAQVTLGGGFGFIGTGFDTLENFQSQLSAARSGLQIDSSAPIPIGVGFIGWQLEKSNSTLPELLSFALEQHVVAVWFAFGNQLARWVQFVRDYDQKARKERKTIIFVQTSSVEEALVAIDDWKVDVVVAQGIESGGHGSSAAPPLLTLVSSILSVTSETGPPILAAGGLSNGTHVASFLTLGASGVVLGTRFLLSPESLYTDAQRQTLVAAGSDLAVRTMAFDHARGTLGWPRGVDGRGIKNSTVDDFEKGLNMEELKRKYMEGVRQDDPGRMVVWAGTGIGLMDTIQPAKEIVEQLHRECMERLVAVARLY